MEMPEGFKRFEDWCFTFDSCRRFDGDVPMTLSNAAKLMKEMAEALDAAIEPAAHAAECCGVLPKEFASDYQQYENHLNTIMNKFKGWK